MGENDGVEEGGAVVGGWEGRVEGPEVVVFGVGTSVGPVGDIVGMVVGPVGADVGQLVGVVGALEGQVVGPVGADVGQVVVGVVG